MKLPFAIALSLFLLGQITSVHAAYTETMALNGLTKNLQMDYGVSGNGTQDDSAALQQTIDNVAATGGGSVYLPQGKYRLVGVRLQSNVHLLIEKDAVILPHIIDPSRKLTILIMGGEKWVENTSIRGIGGPFIVELPPHEPGITVIGCSKVRNFLIANMRVNDSQTVYSSIGLSPYLKNQASHGFPENGTIRNCSAHNADHGYGLIQAQAARNVHFENLHGEGGVPLRLETGWKRMNDLQFGGVWDITGKNISCVDGHCAVMIAPHSMPNGQVTIDGVRTEGCAYAVKIGAGYVAHKKQKNPDLKPGFFADGPSVRNIHAVFGMRAQLKAQDIAYLPKDLLQHVTARTESRGKIARGPSVSAVSHHAPNVKVENVTYEGFKDRAEILTGQDLVTGNIWQWLKANGR